MKHHKVFCIVTNLLGVNFYDFKISIFLFFGCQIFMHLFSIFSIVVFPFFLQDYFRKGYSWYSGNGVFDIIQIFQSFVPYLLQNVVIIRAFFMKAHQKDLELKLKSKFWNYERNFLFRILLFVFVRIIRFLWVMHHVSLVFNSQSTFPELIYCSNDLMFVYYVELLIEYLDYINHKVKMMKTQNDLKIIKREILEVFVLKRKILERYSIDIFITIFFHFLQSIISLYWTIMRLIFNHFQYFGEFANFLYYFEFMFIFWMVFSRCEKFYSKVSIKI